MSQHDYNLADAAGASFRSDLNSALGAIVSRNSGATAPSTTFAYMVWIDTTAGVVKRRNAANSAWIIESTIDETFVLSRSTNTILDESDRGKVLIATAGFTQTLTAAATLGDGWSIDIVVDSGATLVIDPNASETVDGATTKSIVGPVQGKLVCNGTLFRTVGFVSAFGVTLGTKQSISGGSTSYDFTSLPSNVKEITLTFSGMSTSGTSNIIIQIGDSGGIENTGYLSTIGGVVGASAGAVTTGFGIASPGATSVMHGRITLTLLDPAANTWSASSVISFDAAQVNVAAGSKSLSATLDRIRLTTAGGSDTFDAGNFNIAYKTGA
jgi:hypothetical protein